MRGELSETSAADLCRGLADAGATGVVEVDHGSGQGRVFFDAGHICWAESPAPRARLGDRLVNAAILTTEELDGALSAQAEADPPAKLGTVLVERGLVGPDVVRVFVQEQILDALFELVGWDQGEFRFSPEGIPEDEVPVRLDVEDALSDVARRTLEWAEIRRTVPDLDVAPALVSGSSSVAAALEPDEFAIMASLDGRRSVRDLAADLGYGEFEAARLVHGLVVLGLVDLGTAPAPTSDPDLDVGAALDEAFAQRESAAPAADSAAARPEVRVHRDPERLEPRRRAPQEPEPVTSDEPDPEPMAFGQEDPPPASVDAEPASPDVDLDDDEFDQLLEELATTGPDDGTEREDGSPEPVEDTAEEPEAAAPAPAPPATDPAADPAAPPTVPEPATSPDDEAEDGPTDGAAPSPDAARAGRRRDGGGGDVSEFLRELSRLAVDEDEPRAQEPRRPSKDSAAAPASDGPPPSERPDRPTGPSSPEPDDDDDKKKRGLFGWGR